MASTQPGSTELAAIMFTDIVGYSRMMEQDEALTIDLLRRHNDIVLPLISASGGEVIDAIGDGLFVLFPSVRSAVTCGTSIHDAIALANRDQPPSEQFQLRIGIHLGEIWRDGDRVYGNGVNIAARVQPFARPGGLCITEDVHRQIAGNPANRLRSVGAHNLKNISRRIELYEVETGHETDESDADDHATDRDGARPASGPSVRPASPGTSDERRPRDSVREFDKVKDRLISERERMAARHAAGDPDSVGHAIESKVFSVVEHVMDRALAKWEEMPAEKKDKIVGRIQDELGERASSGDVEIVLGGSRVTVGGKRRRSKEAKLLKDARESLGFGAFCSIGFGLGYFVAGIGWMVWPLALLGAIPLLSGVTKLAQYIGARRRSHAERPRALERQILSLARELGGTVTVVQLAARTDSGLDEIQATLDAMAAKGYVTQLVRSSGVVEYEFPKLL